MVRTQAVVTFVAADGLHNCMQKDAFGEQPPRTAEAKIPSVTLEPRALPCVL